MELQNDQGLRLVLDPSSMLDLRGVFVDGVDLSPHRAIPDDGDRRIDHSLEGFLFTCGPDHIRHPAPIPGGHGARYPLHGSFSGHAAKVISSSPDECSAVIDVRHADGGLSRLERRWSLDRQGVVRLCDRLINCGEDAFPAFYMYHMNIAARLFDDHVQLEGAMLDKGGFGWRFGAEPGGVFCVPAGPEEDGFASIRLGPIAAIGGKTLLVRFDTATLPHLQIWRNQKAPADVLGIEPVSHRWVDRPDLEAAGEFLPLQPGEAREFSLSFAFL
ncbi:DUF4432 family protein [Allorhizobium sp. BGMRC 0089]|uniref:DUF4432 family protein n=1 Tax=Allorhizobium sonneratiae TaxID=2934936 RepID=UPI0020348584|nr:DUF4432 family protein [Allorhizobium sonneratiae]MCM2294173.1 DUF4432 family protein [Allorhizobium sonneratiae]